MSLHTVLLLGGGGREHAIAWTLNRSPLLERLFIAPGNPGMESLGSRVKLDTADHGEVSRFCHENGVDLVIVGPEKPLVDGLADHLETEGISVFGPRKDAARLEGSKEFAKSFMEKYRIPTAGYKVFASDRFHEIPAWVEQNDRYPVVLKADGLAAGKGVFICESLGEVNRRLEQYREDSGLSDAASRIIVEEFMEGEEASVFVISDGYTARILHNAQDHKRALDGDKGLNTGGMGAYSPAPVLTGSLMEQVEEKIIQPTITGMQLEETPYQGILYVGLMITEDGPRVVEYNCRFGDPECQVILPSLENDLLELMILSEEQRLDEKEIHLDPLYRCCVVLASGGYPGSYEKGKVIRGVENVDEKCLVFYAGTDRNDKGELITAGGRVLNVIGSGHSLREAIDHSYRNVGKISFSEMHYRKDIGEKGLHRLD